MKSALLIVCVVVAGCSHGDKNATNVTNRVGTTTITSARFDAPRGAPSDDAKLVRRVEAALAADPKVSMEARNVEVETRDGIVTLVGSVDDPASKRIVGDRAARVPGVVDTLNTLEVSPSRDDDDRASDDTISFSLERSLAGLNGAADDVTIDVSHGIVTLRGTALPDARADVERIARETPGVVVVVDDLRWNER